MVIEMALVVRDRAVQPKVLQSLQKASVIRYRREVQRG